MTSGQGNHPHPNSLPPEDRENRKTPAGAGQLIVSGGPLCYDGNILAPLVSFDLLSLRSLTIALLLLAVIGAFGSAPAWANGRATIIAVAEAEPYRVEVAILPSRAVVNNTHLSVRVMSLSSEETLTEATVRVTATGPETATDFGPIVADNNVLPQFFEATLPFDTPGDWQLRVSVASDLGEAAILVPLEVRESRPINLIMVAAIVVAVVALSIWTYDRIRGRRRSRRRAA